MKFPKALEMKKICRACLSSDANERLFNLFDEKDADGAKTIAEILSVCTIYKVERFDELPHLICGTCMTAAREAYRFKKQCEQSYRHLIILVDELDQNDTTSSKFARPTDDVSIKSELGAYENKTTQTEFTTLYPCEHCEAKFFTYDTLKIHREQAHKDNAVWCRVCEREFNCADYLKTHNAVYHPETGDKSSNTCNFCKHRFVRREHFQRHLTVVHKVVELEDTESKKELYKRNDIAQHAQECDMLERTIVTEGDPNLLYKAAENSNKKGNIKKDEIAVPTEAETNNVRDTHNEEMELGVDENLKGETANSIVCTNSADDDYDAEDGQPLVNFRNNVPIASFIEVLLNENSIDKGSKVFNDEQEKENTDVLMEAEETKIDKPPASANRLAMKAKKDSDKLLQTVKRARGRPPRIKSCNNLNTKVADGKSKSKSSSNSVGNIINCAGSKYICGGCSAIFRTRLKLERHMQKTVHGSTTATVKLPAEGNSQATVTAVATSETATVTVDFNCDECDEKFERNIQLVQHKRTQHNSTTYKCNSCDKRFRTITYLRRHMAAHERKRFACKGCSQSYVTKEELNAHIKEEGHNKPMLCPECGLRCKTSNILMVHMRRHNGEKPFKCRFCSKGFPRSDDLRVHEKYHTGEKSHFCDTCGKGFQRKYNLTIHLRVHTGYKPYKCPHCSQAFAQGNDLKAHIRRHTGERFRCELCGAAFLQIYQIRQHKLKEHGIKEDPPIQRVAKFTSREEQEQQIKQNLQRELANAMNANSAEQTNLNSQNGTTSSKDCTQTSSTND